MVKRILCLALLASVVACMPDEPLSPAVPSAEGVSASLLPQPSEWRGHWQSPNELWVYDADVELGLNAHYAVTGAPQKVADLGMRLIRHTLYWERADPQMNRNYNQVYLNQWEQKLQAAEAAGLEMVAIVHGMYPDTSRPHLEWSDWTPTEFNQRFSTFLSDMSARFPSVRFWQIWNEQEQTHWAGPWKSNGDSTRVWGQEYAKTLRAVYPVLKQDPNDWVLLGGMASIDPDYVHGMYSEFDRSGGKPYPFDFMAFHAYDSDPSFSEGPYGKVHSLTPIMNQYGDVNRPIWVTESGTSANEYIKDYGWPTGDAGAVFDEAQRQFYEDLLGGMASSPVTKVIAYALIAGEDDTGPINGVSGKNYNLSLLRENWDPRPSYTWLYNNSGTTESSWNHVPISGSYSVPTYGTIPANEPFQYTSNGVRIDSLEVNTLTPTTVEFFAPIRYQASTLQSGWQAHVYNNQVAGTASSNQQMRQLRVVEHDNFPEVTNICYQAHSSVVGWGAWGCDNALVGSSSYQMEAVRMKLYGTTEWSICYQVYIPSNYGWTGWSCDGADAGTVGQAKAMSAVRIQIRRRT